MVNNSTPLGGKSNPMPLGEIRPKARPNSIRRENEAIEISVATNKPAEEVALELEDGGIRSAQAAKSAVPDPVTTTLISSTENGEDPAIASKKLLEASEKKRDLNSSDSFFLEGSLTANDPNFSPALSRLLTNQQIANEVLEEKFKDEIDDGFFGRAVDFIDRYIFRHIPIGMYEDITRESESVGLELAQAQVNLSPSEYRDYIERYADSVASEGFFKGDNYFAFREAVEESLSGGYDPTATLNQVLASVEAIPLLKAPLSAGKFLTRVGGLRGPKAATEALESVTDTVPGTHPEIQSESIARQFDLATSDTSIKPILGRVAEISQNNKLIQDVQYLYRSGTFGRVATEDQIMTAANKVRANVELTTSRTIADENVSLVDPLSLGDYTSVFRLGKAKDGAPYRSEANANKYAQQLQDRGLAARSVLVDPNDTSKGYYVEVAERLDLTKAADPVDLTGHQSIFNRTLGRVLGSTMQLDDDYLNTLANMGESGSGAIREAVQPYLKPLEELPLESKTTIGQVFKDLRDGPDAYIRDGYSELEFRQKFRQYHPKGKKPTEKDIEAFYAAKTVSDAAYILQANKIALRYVEKGYKSLEITDNVYVPGRIANNVGGKDNVLNVNTGRLVVRSDLSDDTVIWKLDRELEGGVDLVALPKNVTTIRYEDVLGYNAGGRRINPDAKYFVTSGSRAILTSFTENQARLAAKQLDNIFQAARRQSLSVDQLTNQLDDVIKENNDWNPSIENTRDFVDLLSKKKWDLSGKVSIKPRDGLVEGTESDLFAGLTMDDYVKASYRRSDDVLMDFGGNETFNYNPIKSMVDQLSTVSSEYSFRAYTQQSKTSWLKAAGFGNELKNGANVNALWASVDANKLQGAKGRRLRELKAIIDRRDMVQSPISQALSDVGESIAEYVFERTGGKIKVNLAEMDVAGTLLNLGFRSAFGFFNISQFLLQSSHAFVIGAISPRYGTIGAGLVIPLRLAMASKDATKGIKRLAKVTGISEADMDELVKYINTSGRKMIENDAIEKGTGPGWGYSSWEGQDLRPSVVRKTLFQASKVVNKVDQAGLAAFNEGERLARWTAIITAFLEYKAKFKGASAMSDAGRAWITRREQNLSFNMTTTSRGAWQSGLMKVPTQWLSYSMRSLENVALGRGFTKGERARMALMLSAMGGTSGLLFFPNVADQLGEKYNLDPTSPAFVGLQYGIYDAILTWGLQEMTGEELRTAFGTRLAPLTAFSDMYRKVTEESTITALGGPSGEIVGGGVAALFKSIGSLVSGNTESGWADIERVLRTPSGIDNIVKATGIVNNGIYRSKSGTELPMEFSDLEAAMQAVGVTNYRVADYYAERTGAFRSSRDVRKFRKEIETDFKRSLRLWDEDPERGRKLMQEIEARIEASGFSPADQQSLRRSLLSNNNSEIMDLAIRQLQQDNEFGAKRIESWIQED